jgi:hypothetical protein
MVVLAEENSRRVDTEFFANEILDPPFVAQLAHHRFAENTA